MTLIDSSLLTDDGFERYVNSIDERLLTTPQGRRALSEMSPLAFALIYLPHHLRGDQTRGKITFADLHVALINQAQTWTVKPTKPRECRDAYVASRESGKALALDTPVLTANRGWTTHGDLHAGDQVFDERGEPCNVVGVSELWQDRPCYRLTFSDGESIVADENHEWWAKARGKTEAVIHATKDIATNWLVTRDRGYNEVRYGIKTAGPLRYPEAELPIDPYVLGTWLGDGTSAAGQMTLADIDLDHIMQRLRDCGENPTARKYASKGSSGSHTVNLVKPRPHLCPREHPLYRVTPTRWHHCQACSTTQNKGLELGPRTNRPLVVRLRDTGLLENKHIPDAYFSASYAQRLALLQGLMDTDGHITPKGVCEVSFSNERLTRDTLRLVQTLGIKAVFHVGNAKIYGRFISKHYRITFKTDLPVASLPRKAERIGEINAAGTRQIVNVEQVENQATSCIQVDSSSHLYLVGKSLIPTHNSTMLHLLLPLWAAAHKHIKFIAAFSDSGPQAEIHLSTFKRELDTNQLLRNDFPELCTPRKRQVGTTEADRQKQFVSQSGFTFIARGIDAAVLGMKVGERRPDLLLLDDIEGDESSYSAYQCAKRLTTLQDAILPLNEFARVILTGTVTRVGSIVHDLVRTVTRPDEERAPWVAEQNFKVHYFPPIVTDEQGNERSTWPQKWSLGYLQSIRHTRSYKKNFLNDPMGQDGDYWNDEDFTYEYLEGCSRTLLSIDPFVKKSNKSDPCGLAVISYLPKRLLNPNRPRSAPPLYAPSRCMVEYANDCNKTGKELRAVILSLIDRFPHIGAVFVEDNQGKDLWVDILEPLPVKLICEGNSVPKPVRAGSLHTLYQANRVTHADRFSKAEEQMVSFPGTHDDIVDAIGNGVFRFIKPPAKKISGMETFDYV